MCRILLTSFVLVPLAESWVCTVTCPGFLEDDCRCHDAGEWAMWICTKKLGVSQVQPWFCSQPSCQCNSLNVTKEATRHAGSSNASTTKAVPTATAAFARAEAAPPCGIPCGAPAAIGALPTPATAPGLPTSATQRTDSAAAAGAAAPPSTAAKEDKTAIIVESSDLKHVQRSFLEASPRLRQPVHNPIAILLGISVFGAVMSLVSFCRGNRSQQAEAQGLGAMRESQE